MRHVRIADRRPDVGQTRFRRRRLWRPTGRILPDGQAVFVALGLVPGVAPERGSWLTVFHSGDGGVTSDEKPTVVAYGHDHPAIAVDMTPTSRKGWIYITTHHESGDGTGHRTSSVFVVRSRNGGKSFDIPAMPSPGTLHNFGEMPVVLSDGTVMASFVNANDPRAPPAIAPKRRREKPLEVVFTTSAYP